MKFDHPFSLLAFLLIYPLSPLVVASSTTPALKAGPLTSLEDAALNPWISPLDQCAKQSGQYHLDMNMGFLNTDYFCRIDPKLGVQFDTKTIQATNRDAARLILSKVNNCQFLNSERILVGASRNSVKQIQELLPNSSSNSIIKIGKRDNTWNPPETHAKVFQLDNGVDQFFTVHGSLNLQTVGLTCKANNALRFTETNPALYNYFQKLGDAVQANDGRVSFGNKASLNSTGTDLPPVNIGNYQVYFYGGKGTAFVGPPFNQQSKAWPNYINPPVNNQHAPDTINWYDNIIFDAAAQLRQGRTVKIDVLIFEVGEESAFVNNLWRFVQNGFENGKSEDKTSSSVLPSPYLGKLEVRFLWQFQSGNNKKTQSYANLNGANFVSNTKNNYQMQTARIWPILNSSRIAINPGTPRDMHNKLAILDIPGYEQERRLYISSSNMDTPGIGSGNLWQAGTIVVAKLDTSGWSGPNSHKPNLWNAYQQYFDLLWSNREGQPNAGQIQFSKMIDQKRSDGYVNWIETTSSRSNENVNSSKEGIDAFFFPIPIQ